MGSWLPTQGRSSQVGEASHVGGCSLPMFAQWSFGTLRTRTSSVLLHLRTIVPFRVDRQTIVGCFLSKILGTDRHSLVTTVHFGAKVLFSAAAP